MIIAIKMESWVGKFISKIFRSSNLLKLKKKTKKIDVCNIAGIQKFKKKTVSCICMGKQSHIYFYNLKCQDFFINQKNKLSYVFVFKKRSKFCYFF